jgi:hypothetical protein
VGLEARYIWDSTGEVSLGITHLDLQKKIRLEIKAVLDIIIGSHSKNVIAMHSRLNSV